MAQIKLVVHQPKKWKKSSARFKALDLTGKRFGRLVVVKRLGLSQYYRTVVLCKCDCGKTYICESWQLLYVPKRRKKWGRKTAQQSCGCIRKERAEKHWNYIYGARTTHRREFNSYSAMKYRCLNPKVAQWNDYGGRGIKICKRWLEPMPQGFLNFLKDLGPRPKWMTLDRIDPNGNYEPSNTRWATFEVQANNKRDSAERQDSYEEVADFNY